MPRLASATGEVQTLTPERPFQLPPCHVSWPRSPGRGTVWKVHTRAPVRASQARTSPDGPRGGYSCTCDPVITRLRNTNGGDDMPYRPFGSPLITAGIFRFTTPRLPNPATGFPSTARNAQSFPDRVPTKILGP